MGDVVYPGFVVMSKIAQSWFLSSDSKLFVVRSDIFVIEEVQEAEGACRPKL